MEEVRDETVEEISARWTRIYGALIICLATTFFVMQLLFIVVNLKKCGFTSGFAFTLMCVISFTDCVQLIIHDVIGVFLCVGIEEHDMKIAGALMSSCWILMVTSSGMLSVHRFVWTIWPTQGNRILPPNALKVILLILLALYVLLLTFQLTAYSSMNFANFSWFYDADYPLSWISALLDKVSNYASVILNTLIYTILFSLIFCRRSLARKNKELRTTLLVFPFCAYQVMCFVAWEYLLPTFDFSIYISCLSMITWVIWNGASALTYMMFSLAFRQDIKELMRRLKKKAQKNALVKVTPS